MGYCIIQLYKGNMYRITPFQYHIHTFSLNSISIRYILSYVLLDKEVNQRIPFQIIPLFSAFALTEFLLVILLFILSLFAMKFPDPLQSLQVCPLQNFVPLKQLLLLHLLNYLIQKKFIPCLPFYLIRLLML